VKRTSTRSTSRARSAPHFIVRPGIEGCNYLFQTQYADSWAWLVDGIGQAAQRRDHGMLFLEHKSSEPVMKIRCGTSA
jgi:hypothetical protein